MSASSERMLKLMAYADGELEGDERVEVEALLAKDAEAADVVTQVGSLGDLVRLGHEQAVAPRLAKIDLSDAIMAAVSREQAQPSKPSTSDVVASVASLDAARARKRRMGTVAVAALAVAASVFFMIRQNEQKAEAPIAHAPAPPTAVTPSEAPVVTASMGSGVEVDPVESPGHTVSVFYLPTESELSTSVVVWVDETGEK